MFPLAVPPGEMPADYAAWLTDIKNRIRGERLTAVDRLLAHADDKPTLGLLLVREKNRVLVEYALGGNAQPISVAEWETQLTRALPSELQGSLPTIEEIEAELSGDIGDGNK